MARLDLELGEDTFPPLGGLIYRGGRETSGGRLGFHVIGYRRRPAAGSTWAGRFESIWRGSLECADGAMQLCEGQFRLRERFVLEKDEATTAESDSTTAVVQRVR